jgi:PAS domain-containing protein
MVVAALEGADRAGFADDIASVQRGAKSFSRALNVRGSSRTLLVKGTPAGPDLANPGAAILWLFDATESQTRIAMLEREGALLHDALEALSGLIEAAPLPMWHRGQDLRLGLVNSAYVRAVEAQSAADVIEQQIELFETIDGLPPGEAARIARDKGEVLTRVVPATMGGERRMMQVVEVPMGPVGVAGYAIDRQDYESARTDQARTVASQRDMLDRLTAAVAQFGPDRSLIFWNKAFVTLFALQPEHLVDRPEFERVLDRMREGGRIPEHRDFPAWRSERRAWFTAQEAAEENWLLADGTHLRVFAQPMPDGGCCWCSRTAPSRSSSPARAIRCCGSAPPLLIACSRASACSHRMAACISGTTASAPSGALRKTGLPRIRALMIS